MYYKYLQTFLQVIECGSFSKAAEALFISPVSVMKQINALETEVDVKLLNRTNQGVHLTPAGQSFYQSAKKIIALSKQAIWDARAISTAEQRIIRIGSSPLRPHSIMSAQLSELINPPSLLQFRIVPFSDDSTDLAKALQLIGKKFDCLIGPMDIKHWPAHYNILHWESRPYCVALSRNHILSKKELLTWEDLEGETLMLLKPGLSSEVDALRQEIEIAHPEIRVIDTPRSYTTAVFNECAQMNYLMGAIDIWSKVHPSLVIRPVDWKYQSHYGIVYSKKPPDYVKAFIEAISNIVSLNFETTI